MPIVTCHTQGCGNAEAPIDVPTPTDPETGEPLANWSVECGVCGKDITDIKEGVRK